MQSDPVWVELHDCLLEAEVPSNSVAACSLAGLRVSPDVIVLVMNYVVEVHGSVVLLTLLDLFSVDMVFTVVCGSEWLSQARSLPSELKTEQIGLRGIVKLVSDQRCHFTLLALGHIMLASEVVLPVAGVLLSVEFEDHDTDLDLLSICVSEGHFHQEKDATDSILSDQVSHVDLHINDVLDHMGSKLHDWLEVEPVKEGAFGHNRVP